MAEVHTLSWEPYNECKDLKEQIENYKQRYGRYPEAVCADKIYRTRENLQYCQEYGIRLSGPKLGRPFKDVEKNKKKLREQRTIERYDESTRIAVEGKFGEAKRRYTLDRIGTKLKETSETTIMMVFLVMNLMVVARRKAKAIFVPLIETIIGMIERLNSIQIAPFRAA
jgi:IS5 family transposase